MKSATAFEDRVEKDDGAGPASSGTPALRGSRNEARLAESKPGHQACCRTRRARKVMPRADLADQPIFFHETTMICHPNLNAFSLWTFPLQLQMQSFQAWTNGVIHIVESISQTQMSFAGAMLNSPWAASSSASRSEPGGKPHPVSSDRQAHDVNHAAHPSPLLEKLIAAAIDTDEPPLR